MNVRIKSPNLAALRAAVFTLSAKNLRGAPGAPPARNRVKIIVSRIGSQRLILRPAAWWQGFQL